VSERLSAAHALAREGLVETRRAVGVLRGEGLDVSAALDALLAGHREVQPAAAASLAIAGDPARLEGPVALAVVRVAQEALTNVRKHAPGAAVRVELDVGVAESGALDLRVRDGGHTRDGASVVVGSLAGSGGGYGLRGMRERAQILGGSLQAGPDDDGWRVELRLPLTATAHDLPDAAGGER
jgi:signal transduction histidine kinase